MNGWITGWLCGAVLLCHFQGLAQESSATTLYVSSRYLHGYSIPHKNGLRHLVKENAFGGQLQLEWVTSGKKAWHRQYRRPRLGLSLIQLNLGNDEELGSAIGLYPYLHFPFVRNRYFKLNFQFGGGLAYLSKTFDRVENYKNVAISSHANISIGSALEIEIPLFSNFDLRTGGSFVHFSNAGYTKPNLGINVGNIFAGLAYRFGPLPSNPLRWEKTPSDHRYEMYVAGLIGIKQISALDVNRFLSYTLSGELGRRYSEKAMVSVGLDVIYNTSLKERLRSEGEVPKSDLDLLQPGLLASYHVILDRFSMQFGMGVFLYSSFTEDGSFYHRVGWRYRVNERLSAGISLKSHFFVADYLEFGIGYRWKKA